MKVQDSGGKEEYGERTGMGDAMPRMCVGLCNLYFGFSFWSYPSQKQCGPIRLL